jgi:leucyl aminopeptidase
MKKLDKVIVDAKKLIDLPYNKFNLENYFSVLYDKGLNPITVETKPNLPIKLMSGGNFYSNIVTTRNLYPKKGKNIYVVGKGMLFDSGGYNLKTGRTGSYGMHDDKAGMIIAMSVSNYLGKNCVAYCPVTTNFLHNSKIIPGDEIDIGKKTVKVTNTDAEGRLVLAEAIASLNASKDDIIITIATLTGAVGYAIGDEATGVFSPSNSLLAKYSAASYEAKEVAWALPLWELYQQKYYNKKLIRNSVDEIKCGATEGALFVKQFVPNPNNWIHLDIAYSAFTQGKANGTPLRSLVKFINKLNEKS